MEETEKIQQKLPNQEFDYFKIGKILISRWYWIAAAVVICYIGADVYLWYTPKTYATTSTMKLEEKKSEISDLAIILNNSDKGPSKIQSELFVIVSRGLIKNAIKDLNYPIGFYVAGRVRTATYELYPEKPLDIKTIRLDSASFFQGLITFQPVNNTTFSLSYQSGGHIVKTNFSYNNPVNIGSTTFTISYPGDLDKNISYQFRFNNLDGLVSRAKGGLSVMEVTKNSGIVSLHETDSNAQFAADALNAIMNEYLVYDHDQKQQSASQIISFINKQLDTISGKVKKSETAIEEFKQRSKLMDVGSAAQVQLTKVNEIEIQRNLFKAQLSTIDDFEEQINKAKYDESLNFNTEGGTNQLPVALLTNFNNYIDQKNNLLNTYTPNSPQVKEVDRQILLVRNEIIENLNRAKVSILHKIEELDRQLSIVNERVASFPIAERELDSLNRDFEINEKVYTFLSEKKLDAQISRSAIAPGASVVEPAQANFGPVAPDEHGIRRTAIMVGLIIGLGSIVLIRVLNPYIYDKETVESLTTIPIIGVIRKFPRRLDENSGDILALSQPRSIFAESVRSVRTNLSFLASEKDSKVICITSEVAGEGKSFVAVNLSSTLSLIDKKTVLVAADLRRSKLHKTFHVPNDKGLSNFLAHQCTIDDVILHTNQDNFDFIPSGPVPPNPSELLHTERMKLLVEALRDKYDIIIIDTAPVGLVSDSIPLIRISDINVFVIRSGKSKFYSATIPQRIDQEYHLNNSVIILNAFEEDLLHSRYYTTKFTGENYGSRYYYYSDYVGYESSGYYVDSDQKRWWDIRRWFK